jgi:sulfur carrier protein ThiS
MALAEEHGHPIDRELVEQSRVDALLDDVGRTELSTPTLTKVNGAVVARPSSRHVGE